MAMKGLGKGLDALLGGAPQSGSVSTLSVYLIDNNADQPRKRFDERKLEELAASIEQHGVVQPIIVKPNGERYTIIAGERRFRAARMAGLNEVPVIVRDIDEQEVRELALIENLQRENLNAIEEAFAIRALMDEHDLTQEAVAKRLGKSRPVIANTLRLLTLPEEVIRFVADGHLQSGHCRALGTVTDDALLVELARQAVRDGWSVRETERMVERALERRSLEKRQTKKTKLSNDILSAQDALRERLGTKVSIKGGEDSGRIVIEYYSSEELSGLFDKLMGKIEE